MLRGVQNNFKTTFIYGLKNTWIILIHKVHYYNISVFIYYSYYNISVFIYYSKNEPYLNGFCPFYKKTMGSKTTSDPIDFHCMVKKTP